MHCKLNENAAHASLSMSASISGSLLGTDKTHPSPPRQQLGTRHMYLVQEPVSRHTAPAHVQKVQIQRHGSVTPEVAWERKATEVRDSPALLR